MNNIIGFNNQIGTEPILKNKIEVEVKSGFASLAQKETLIALKVLFGNDTTIPSGSTVYLKADSFLHVWAKRVLKIKDVEFIMVPQDSIILIEKING